MGTNINNQNIDNFLNNIKSTTEYFNMIDDELLEHGYMDKRGFTREESLLFDDGLEVVYFDDKEEVETEKQEFEQYIKSKKYEIKSIVRTINERVAVILI